MTYVGLAIFFVVTLVVLSVASVVFVNFSVYRRRRFR